MHRWTDPARTPEAQATASEQRALLLSAVQTLPESIRQVLTLNLEGLSGAEIADVLGVKTASIKLLLFRARRKLALTLRRQEGR